MSACLHKKIPACVVLLAGLAGSSFSVTFTNVYHTNRVFKPISTTISGTPSAYRVYSLAGKLTEVVGPTSIVVHASANTFAREYEAVAWGYQSANAAWTSVLANYSSHYQTYPTSTYNNVGWIKGTREANGTWGGFLWIMQNQVDFNTSEKNIWVSPHGVTNYIAKVLVGSIGDYAPMANVVDRGPSNWAAITNFLGTGVSVEQVYRGDYTAYYELLALGMTAYRPATENPFYAQPFRRHEVPEAQEETPGVGIRINGDDDNNNGTEDRSDTTVNGENDLIEVTLRANPNPLGLKYILKRNNSNIKVWTTRNKGTALLDANNETNLTFSIPWMTVWVENPNGGTSDLELEARTVPGNNLVASDKLHFYPFTSIIVVLGGETQNPSDPADPNHGVFQQAIGLYQRGYDVHMYDEDVVDYVGAGDGYAEAVSAIQDRDVNQVAIFGYSHGGGSTFLLANLLNNNRGVIGTFTIPFTAYIDAVEDEFFGDANQEHRRPPSSGFHVNYYQEGVAVPGTPGFDYGLDGGPVPGADHEVNVDQPTPTETHQTIDDELAVLNGVVSRLTPRVTR